MLELKAAELRCWIFHCFFCFKIFLSVKPLFCGVIIYLACIVIHQTKPTSMGIHDIKGFWDTLTYKTYTGCLKCGTNFWTPCRKYEDSKRSRLGREKSSIAISKGCGEKTMPDDTTTTFLSHKLHSRHDVKPNPRARIASFLRFCHYYYLSQCITSNARGNDK